MPMQGDEFMDWGPEESTDWRSPGSGVWRLRWHSLLSPAVKGVWQVTLFPPPMSTHSWTQPPGLVASGPVDRPPEGDATIFEIPFTEFAPKPPPEARAAAETVAASERSGTVVISPAVLGAMASLRAQPTESLVRRVRSVPLPDPVTYYVRVVPLGENGEPVGNPSNPVSIRYGTPGPDPVLFDPDFQAALRRIEELEAAERAAAERCKAVKLEHLEWHPQRLGAAEPPYRMVVTADHPFLELAGWKVGQRVKLWPKEEDDVWDDVCDAIGDVGEFIGDAVDWVSTAYEDIKAGIVSFTADLIVEVVPGCDGGCQDAIHGAVNIALESGLAAMGVPPSLPNFDQLQAMGKGYLVDTLAMEMNAVSPVPVPREVAEQIVNEVQRRVEDAANRGPGGGQWLRPDPACQPRPALVLVRLRNTGSEPSGTMMHVSTPGLYVGRTVRVPELQPGASVDVPVFLPEYDLEFHKKRARDEYGWHPDAGTSQLSSLWMEVWSSGTGQAIVKLPYAEPVAVATGTQSLVGAPDCD